MENLNWIYFSKAVKEKRYVIKCERTESDELLGYMVYDMINLPNGDLGYLQLMDYFIPGADENIFFPLISFSVDLAKKINASALRFWTVDIEMFRLLKKLPMIRKKRLFQYFYKLDIKKLKDDEMNFSQYYIPSTIDPDRGTT
jgi:hypothetical protein